MSVRIGVDVGGTFTKAVVCEPSTTEVIAQAVVPTTHDGSLGVTEGVVRAVGQVAAQVASDGLGPVQLVAHSTTQAVNALLEGDTATVGVLGIGRRPDLRKARRRTEVGAIELSPGRKLKTLHGFVDATGGLSRAAVASALLALRERGAEVVCVSEAFGVDDLHGERLALEVASELGIPACAGHELSGLYGLEMRTVTGALNSSILPAALATAEVVQGAVGRDLPGVPLLVMRGDGGAADVAVMRRRPLLTAFSGPAASVAGALRCGEVSDGVVVEVGGTSTNVSLVKNGRPVLAYVRVLDHVTCVRSLDVRVVGVAGGSLLRVARRLGRFRIEDVGPRSAHIAGLRYCSFASTEEVQTAEVRLESPRAGDPSDYVVLVTPGGARLALTPTCAANALERVPQGAYARGNAEAARLGFELLARFMGCDWRAVAGGMLERAAFKIADATSEAMQRERLRAPKIVGLGGGAGALVPALGRALRLEWRIPKDAEVISSIGDALSLVRVEMEKAMPRDDATAVARLHYDVEAAAIEGGAEPGSVQVESVAIPERHALRIVATGSAALDSSSPASDHPLDVESLKLVAKEALHEDVTLVARSSHYAVFTGAGQHGGRFVVVDRHGSIAIEGHGDVIALPGEKLADKLASAVPSMTRHIGPIAVAPAVRLVRGSRLVDLTLCSTSVDLLEAVRAECALSPRNAVVALLSKD